MKKVFRVLAMLAFFMVLGTVGGIEHNSITLGGGAIMAFVYLAAMTVFAKLGGLFY